MTQPNDISQVDANLCRVAAKRLRLGASGPETAAALDALADRIESPTPAEARGEVTDAPLGIDTANHAGVRVRGYTVEQYATLARQLAEANAEVERKDEVFMQLRNEHVCLSDSLAEAEQRVAAVEAAARQLRQDYTRLLEAGRDRIRDLGGYCDPVDVMERSDSALRAFDAALQPKEPTNDL